MKALTVQQPWAWAIMHGGKTIENRTQLWKYRGPLAIHAGMRYSDRGMDSPLVQKAATGRTGFGCWDSGIVTPPAWTTCAAILGTVELVDVHPDAGCCRPWGESAYVEHGGHERRQIVHLVLENARPLAEPIPCTGALGLWTPPADIIAQLEREGRP
ncbi:hypothetical protein [Antrihabitans spumae]|uniref:ASCH domain-containing protein n=1 Tax=Antrihabitans spumae TaxID=3373370 RepID=A0ABW7KDX2_9NOCA